MIRRILAALLRLAPEPFRSRHAEEFLAVHDARRRAGGGGVGFAVREIAGTGWMVVRLHLGGADATTTTTTGGAGPMETLGQDLRFAVRSLLRNPGFAATAVVVLALGIGANTAIFSAANAFLFRPLPFAESDRLVSLYETNPEFGWQHANAAPANVLDWAEQVDAFEAVAMYSSFLNEATWIGADGEPRIFRVSSVTGNFFDVLGVPAALGRSFRADETWSPDDRVVVLSHGLWTREFGADPGIVGRSIDFGTTRSEVVGVMPEGFTFPSEDTDLWTPWGWDRANRDAVWFRRAHWVLPVARLSAGATPAEADAQLQVVVERLSREYPGTNRVMGAGLMPMRRFLTRDVRAPLGVLLGAVAVLLLLACVNVANLVLVRGADRGREVALRYALGSGRWRVVRLMLTESFVLAGVGGALGLGLGWAGVLLIARLDRLGIEGATAVALDGRVVLFVLAATLLSGVLFGLLPALGSSGRRSHEALKAGGRGVSGAGARSGLVRLMVGAEVALALLLVVGAGLMVRSFWLLRDVDPGFATQGTLAVTFQVPSSRYEERNDVLAFYDRLIEALEARPDIEAAGTVGQLPLNGTSWSSSFQAEGWPPDRVGFEILHRRADAGYFEALEIPLVRGRMFGPQDGPETPLVVLVNEAFGDEHFPGEDPVGQRIAYDRTAAQNPDDSNWYEIVGIVGDQHQVAPGRAPRPEVFENRSQDWGRRNWVVVRTEGDPLAVVPTVRSALAELDPLIPVSDVRPLRQVWRGSMAREEFILTLLGVFGVVALLLAAVGVYGVTAQAARARTHEIGIRMALGAAGRSVVALMVRQALYVVALGLLVGLGASVAASRVLSGFLFGIEPTDPGTLMAVVALLGGVAAVACYVPARRATAVDPVRSLRAE